jgi:sec-independent protein translocase protein TatA
MGPFGASEIVFLFILALVIFGPKKLPEIGKTLGKGMREFRKATDDLKSNWEEHIRDTESPVQDLKQTLNEVKNEVTASTSEITNEVTAHVNDLTSEVEASTSLEEKPPSGPQEETKPDAH